MDRLKQLETFAAVVSRGSLSAAAQAEGVAPAVIGRRLDAREERLGVKLMVRTTRKLTLTSAGTSYLDKCRTILDLVEVAEADVMEARLTPRGNLRIGLPLSYGLKRVAPLLPAFQKNFPEISLALDFTDRHINLIDEGIEAGLRLRMMDLCATVHLE